MSKSYSQILRTSTITGGSVAAGLLIGMVSVKVSALFLGPSGVGALRLFQSLFATVTQVAGLGIGSSGIKAIAEAEASGDEVRLSRTIGIMQRASLLAGLLGTVLAASLAWPLSRLVFGSTEYAPSIAVASVSILLAIVASGQVAIVQGRRRIGTLARISVQTALAILCACAPLYWLFEERAIVPAILVMSGIRLAIAWIHARRVKTPPSGHLPWRDVFAGSRQLLGLGMAMMWSGVAHSLVTLATGSLVLQSLGSESNGYLTAAWALSGMCSTFILGAMAADYFPRLTAVQSDHEACGRLVLEQAEIGVLLALPALVATLFFAPFAISLLYTSEFSVAADLSPWFVLGVFGQITSWPVGYVFLAKGSGRTYFATETAYAALHLGLIVLGLRVFGLAGVGMAFLGLSLATNVVNVLLARRMIGFRWKRQALGLALLGAGILCSAFVLCRFLSGWPEYAIGACATIACTLFSYRGLVLRIGHEHRLVRIGGRVPVLRHLLERIAPPRADGQASGS